MMVALNRIVNSALWAAYGDAMGFITELVDQAGLKRRIGKSRVELPVSWKRTIGGKFGPIVELPPGCYSDDTQLRLSTSRAIRGDGTFDVEAFAKIELPVWPCYSLGGGRGSKIAASSLARQDVNWFSNFYEENGISYFGCGGNGAAMRIQPHIWAARELFDPKSYLIDILRNAICTHGHPRGFMGAVFHGMCLAFTLANHRMPAPIDWKKIISYLPTVSELIKSDKTLGTLWLPVWEKESKNKIENSIFEIVNELSLYANRYEKMQIEDPLLLYKEIAYQINALEPNTRGSGTKTSFLAMALAWSHRNQSAQKAMEAAANLLSSDTDTIASMAGAILGVVCGGAPETELMDASYIRSEALRLFKISEGQQTISFEYPDLQTWQAPKSQVEAVGVCDGKFCLSGLAQANPTGRVYESRGKDNFVWEWLELSFGQTVIAKRRSIPKALPLINLPVPASSPKPGQFISKMKNFDIQRGGSSQQSLFSKSEKQNAYSNNKSQGPNLNYLTKQAIDSGFDPSIIGKHILMLSEEDGGIEKAIAYVAIISKARIVRIK